MNTTTPSSFRSVRHPVAAARAHPGAARRIKPPSLKSAAFAVMAALAFPLAPVYAQSLPTGGTVVGGQATISQPTATSMQINQSTQLAALNWTSFSIAAGNSVAFVQPSSSAIALNRVIGGNPSAIYGSLTSNGQVFLVNPSGILFAPGASINVGGLAASTLDISTADFMAGRYNFVNGGSAGSVVNQGVINAAGGYVALLGPQVSNEGIINARMGTVALAAGDRVALDMVGDGLISVRVDQAALNASIINKGTISADGGNVLLTARSANALLDTVINTEGVIRADSIAERNGAIYLDGGPAGVTSVSGTLSASGTGAGETGGNVTVLGQYVGLFDGANINVSGDAGGGTVLVGGNFQGNGPEQNAFRTYVASGATINADAITNGNGGKVIVWADDATKYYGSISVRGGAQGGDGGFVEVSGKGFLDFNGLVNATAPKGKIGTLLLDPTNIEVIDNGNATTLAQVNEFTNDADLTTCANLGGAVCSQIDPDTINAAGANVVLQATDTVLVTNAISIAGAGISFAAQAGNNIILNAGITTNGGAITLTANDQTTGAALFTSGSIFGTSGALTTMGGAGANGGNIMLSTSGTGTITVGNINTSGGAGGAAQAGGNGGTVQITTVDGNIDTGTITTSGGNGGAATNQPGFGGGTAGNISITAGGATGLRAITLNTITAKGGTGSAGEPGPGGTDEAGGTGGAGGTVTITGTAGFGATLDTAGIDTSGGAGGLASDAAAGGLGGDGKNVTINVTGFADIGAAVSTKGGDGGNGDTGANGTGGAAGTVSVTSGDSFVTLTGVTTTGGAVGTGGTGGAFGTSANVTVSAGTDITLNAAINATATAANVTAVTPTEVALGFGKKNTGGIFTIPATTITADTVTATGGTGSDTIIGTSQTYNLTGANAGNNGTVFWTSVENLTDTAAGVFNMHSTTDGSVSGNISAVNGSMSYAGYTTPVSFGLAGTANTSTGITGTRTGITSVTGSGNSDTITGSGATYNLTGANAGNNGTISWTSFENLTDAGAGVFNMHSTTDGSVSGNILAVNGSMSYAGYTTPVSFGLAGTANTSTGITGTRTGITSVTGSGNSDTITGSGATYNLTGLDAGNSGGISWTSFENLTDAAAGVFNMHSTTDGSVSGNILAVNGSMSYAGYTTPVSFGLAGTANTSTGITGTRTGITSVTGSGNSDTITGNNATYNLTSANAGNSGGIGWTSFEQIADAGTGTISTTGGQFYNLTGADTGIVTTLLPGGYTGIGNLTDDGAAVFNMYTGADGSVSGNITAVNGSMSYAGYTTPVSFGLGGTATGVGGTWSGITSVTGSSNSDTITGSGATYNLTGLNTGTSGTVSWGSFENLTDSGAGVFNMHSGADGSVSGNITAVNGSMSYANYTTPVGFGLGGTATGIGGTWSGITSVTGSSNSDTITGSGATYNLTGANAGDNGTVFWTSFENLTDAGGGTFNGGGSIDGALTALGTSTLNGILGVGSASFAGNVTLASDTTVTSAGDVTFSAPILATTPVTESLTINSGGTINLNYVGYDPFTTFTFSPLSSLTTTGGGSVFLNGDVYADGQSYTGNVTLNGNWYYTDCNWTCGNANNFLVTGTTTVNSSAYVYTGPGNATFTGPVSGAGGLTVDAQGNVMFGSTINQLSYLNVYSDGTTTFTGNIGAGIPLGSIETGGSTTFGGGTVVLPSVVNTTGDQTYFNALTLGGADVTFTAGGSIDAGWGAPNDFAGKLVTATAGGYIWLEDPSGSLFNPGNMTAGNFIYLNVDRILATGTPGATTFDPAQPTLTAGNFIQIWYHADFAAPDQRFVNLFNVNTPTLIVISPTPPGGGVPGQTTVQLYQTYFTTGGALPSTVIGIENTFTNGAAVFVNNQLLNNNPVGGQIIAQPINSVLTSINTAATQAAANEAKKSFGTDSVAQQIDFGFVGDVSVSPPMAHSIEGNGISMPDCAAESVNNEPCK